MPDQATLESNVVDRAQAVIRLIDAHPIPSRTPEQQADLTTDMGGLRHNLDALLGEEEDTELVLLRQISTAVATISSAQQAGFQAIQIMAQALDRIESLVRIIYRSVTVAPSAVWKWTYQGRTISGRTPVAATIKDTDAAWSFAVGDFKDPLGEPVDKSTVGIAVAVADPTLITLVDNGDGTGTVVFAGVASFPGALPAATGITAHVTPVDGSAAFDIADTVTVAAADAVTGDFVFTPPATA